MKIVIHLRGKPDLVIRLDARKTMDGNILIQDHPYMDIIISPKTKKIMALSKVLMDDRSYYTQSKFFDYLYKRGVIDPSTVQASNIYASLEATIPEQLPEGPDPIEVVLFSIFKYFREEAPTWAAEEKLKHDQEEYLLGPDDEHSTELGEIPQKARQGSIGTSAYSINKHYNIAYLGEGKDKEKK
jgi:hypothetical protein